MVRIAVDAMGGDRAPGAVVRGAVQALEDVAMVADRVATVADRVATVADRDCRLLLIGDESRIRAELEALNVATVADRVATVADRGIGPRVEIIHASESIGMDEAPVEALRHKQDASLMRMVKLAAAGEADVIISAGNTGAFAAACQLKLKPLEGVSRPGIAVTIPGSSGPVVLCDVGANIQARPRHLYEYAVMAGLYAETVVGLENPRVGLLSIGEESRKGTELVKQTHALLADDPRINFIGNVEGEGLFRNRCDVAICDGFVGNIALKLMESLAEGLLTTISRELESASPRSLTASPRSLTASPRSLTAESGAGDSVREALKRVWARHDYSEYGGAPLLGVDGVCIICHGRSDERAIRNAIRTGEVFLRTGFIEAIRKRLAG